MLFSVVIPTFNRASLICRSVNSVLSQTISDFELIIVDDGSTDDTEKVVMSILDPRIVYIRQENKGATAARNNGVRHAKGKYVSFLDSDDIWYPTTLEKQLEKFDSDNDINCVYGDLDCISEKGEKYDFWHPTRIEGFIYKEALTQGFLSPMIVLSVKRECFDQVGMFDETLPASQDDDICFKLSKQFKFGYVPYKLAGVYTNVGGRISSSNNRVATGWWMIWNKYEKDVIEYCGKRVLLKHLYQCLLRFCDCNNQMMRNACVSKIKEQGGHLSLFQRLILSLYSCSKGYVKDFSKKILLISI